MRHQGAISGACVRFLTTLFRTMGGVSQRGSVGCLGSCSYLQASPCLRGDASRQQREDASQASFLGPRLRLESQVEPSPG